jgi:ubiquinone biosynthesis protein COQ4
MEDPMATAIEPLSTRPQSPRLRPLRALRLFLDVLRDPDDTEGVYAFFEAMGGDEGESQFREFLAEPDGRRLLAARSSLVSALADEARLEALPAHSLGSAYLAAMRARGFMPSGLLEARESARAGHPRDDAEHEWFYERLNVMHDLWHVLTGYGTDPLGEAALLAFSQAQIPNRGFPVLLLGAVWKGPRSWTLDWPRYLWRAYRRGRAARLLTAAPLEEWLARPLGEVREELGVGSPAAWHPEGVWIGELNRGRA